MEWRLPIMGKQAKRAYLEAIRGRYRKAKQAGKTKILDEFCAVRGYNRKYAIRLLGRKKPASPPRRAGRKPKYAHPQLLEALRRIWLASDQLCGKRLKVALPLWLPCYEAEYGALAPAAKSGLPAVSASTLDRLLKLVRVEHPKGLCGTKSGTLLKSQIPLRCEHWDVSQPGFVEADTVAHCGNSLAGDFVWSLTMTDILSGRKSRVRGVDTKSATMLPKHPISASSRPMLSPGQSGNNSGSTTTPSIPLISKGELRQNEMHLLNGLGVLQCEAMYLTCGYLLL